MSLLNRARARGLTARRTLARSLPYQFKLYYLYLKLLRRLGVRRPSLYLTAYQDESPLPVLHLLGAIPSLIVDVGANTGTWTQRYLDLLGARSEFHLVEPTPALQESLARRFQDAPTVTLHALALSDRAATALLNVASSSDLSSLEAVDALTVRDFNPTLEIDYIERVEVRTESLDGFYALHMGGRTVDLLKLDVQGHEIAVLQPSTEALARTRAILVEWNIVNYYQSPANFTAIHALLLSKGFALSHIPFQHCVERQMMYADALYLNRAFLTNGAGERA